MRKLGNGDTGTMSLTAGAVLGVIAFVAVFLVGNVSFHQKTTEQLAICLVERTATDDGGEYRIYAVDVDTEEERTFVLKDSYWPPTWRTDTADVYGRLARTGDYVGTYDITHFGWRVGFLSMFPNIGEFNKTGPTNLCAA